MKTTEHTEAALPREAYTLLAQANLLRMRGRWDEAVEKCMAALRLTPDSATAQSLLGDIYENQGRYDDAIQWYRMALDVNPDSPADKLKLGRLREAGHHRPTDSQHGERTSGADPATKADGPRAEAGSERLLRGMAWLAAALFLVAAVLAGVMMSRGQAVPTPITAPPVVVSTSDTNTPPTPTSNGDPAATVPAPSAPPAPAPAADPAELTLLQTLQQDTTLTSQNVLPEDVQMDPRQNAVTLTVLCPAPAVGGSAREALLRDAALAGQAGSRAQGDRVTSWTVRCLMVSPGGAATDAPGLALVADATTAALTALGSAPVSLSATQLQPAFHNVWWSPSVP